MHKEPNNNNQERPSNLLRFGGHFVQGGSNEYINNKQVCTQSDDRFSRA